MPGLEKGEYASPLPPDVRESYGRSMRSYRSFRLRNCRSRGSMRALLINVGHGSRATDDHPRHNVAPIDLALCASILEESGYRVDLWDTAVTPSRSSKEVAELVASKEPDLLLIRPLHGCDEPMQDLLAGVQIGSWARDDALAQCFSDMFIHVCGTLY